MDIIQKPLPLFLLGFLVAVAYIPGIIGATTSTSWFVIIAVAPFYLYRLPGLFLGFAILSLAWTVNFNIGFFYLLQLIALACIFQLGERLSDPRPIIHGLALGLGFSSLVSLLQYFYDYKDIYSLPTAYGTAGLFVNPNIFCEVSAIILITLLAFKLYWWIPVTLPALFLVHSRTALLALLATGLVWIWKVDKRFLIVPVIVIVILTTYYSNGHFNFNSIQERLNLWVDTTRGLVLFGNGVGSFEIQYPLNAINIDTSLARPKYAHNDLLQLFFEFGIGVCLLIPIIYRMVLSGNIIIYCIGIISLFTYPFHTPMVAFLGCLVAGHICRNNDTVCVSGNSRRPALSKGIKRERYSTV